MIIRSPALFALLMFSSEIIFRDGTLGLKLDVGLVACALLAALLTCCLQNEREVTKEYG